MTWLSKYVRTSYFLAFFFLFMGLPVSKGLMSVGIGWLIGTWVLEGGIKDKFSRFIANKPALVATAILPLELLAITYTEDLEGAWRQLKIHLPLYALPLIVSTMPAITKSEKSWYYGGFLFATGLNMGICLLIGTGMTGTDIPDVRDASIFISHMRLSMMVVMSIVLTWSHSWLTNRSQMNLVRILISLGGLLFLFWMKSLTAVFILMILGFVVGIIELRKFKSGKLISGVIVGLILAQLGFLGYIIKQEQWNFSGPFPPIDIHASNQTAQGNPYWTDETLELRENGELVWAKICDKELLAAWSERSRIPFNGEGRTGQNIRATLIRYLASKGLAKDYQQVMALTDEEVHAVEGGIANVRLLDGKSFSDRIYEVLWEVDRYQKGADPSGNSLTQRLEFWIGAMDAIGQNPWFGVGTGDGQQVLDQAYAQRGRLHANAWKKAHNQYLTFALQVGVIGLMVILASLIWPFIALKSYHNTPALLFLIIMAVSMMMEDTLDTQAGTTFFAVFFNLFLFAKHADQPT